MNRKQRTKRTFSALILLLALLLTACGTEAAPAAVPAPADTVVPAQQPAETPIPEPPAPIEPPMPMEAAVEISLTPSEESVIEPPFSPDLEEREPVEDSFFDDTAFLGNSLVRGLELYGGMTGGDFCAITSTSVVNIDVFRGADLKNGMKGTLLQMLFQEQYKKIYILLGINEISFETDFFIEAYGEMLDKIEANEPDAQIYIMSLTPVTRAKAEEKIFTPEKLAAYNAALYNLAQERGYYYVDLMDALADEEGFLPDGTSEDGVHMKRSKYIEWADYLRTHYVPVAED